MSRTNSQPLRRDPVDISISGRPFRRSLRCFFFPVCIHRGCKPLILIPFEYKRFQSRTPNQVTDFRWAMKKRPLVVQGIGGIILPSYMGIMINRYRDPASLLNNQCHDGKWDFFYFFAAPVVFSVRLWIFGSIVYSFKKVFSGMWEAEEHLKKQLRLMFFSQNP